MFGPTERRSRRQAYEARASGEWVFDKAEVRRLHNRAERVRLGTCIFPRSIGFSYALRIHKSLIGSLCP